MRALLYRDGVRLETTYPQPQPGQGESLVRVKMAGICNTDVEITRGYRGFSGVLGHEFVGLVERSEDADLIGQRVVGEINCGCGACLYCQQGMHEHCLNRSVLGIAGRDGAFADYLVLPSANLHIVPATIPDEEAVFVEPLAAALEITEQVHIRPTQRVVVLGDGKLGLLAAQVLSLTGCHLTVLGKHPEKLAIVGRRGLETAILGTAEVVGADVVVDCTGQASGFALAKSIVRPRGTIVVKSTFHDDDLLPLSPLVVDEVTVVGSRCGPFKSALRLLERRLVDVASLVTAIYPLDDGVKAFQQASTKGALKILLRT
ncbi:MAG: alcohol dehydrogenase catalytic domain-containing protein [Chloroflexi bacterium]|nr:alcohol dehydrogenase catalytic domain-containing protein [Chloroflexota bacterium]